MLKLIMINFNLKALKCYKITKAKLKSKLKNFNLKNMQ